MAAICYSDTTDTANVTGCVRFRVTATTSDYDPYATTSLSYWPSTYYIHEITPPAKASRNEFLSRSRRPQRLRWERWSNQFHSPAYDVFKPVRRELPRGERIAPQKIGRVRRARVCSSSASLQPYSP